MELLNPGRKWIEGAGRLSALLTVSFVLMLIITFSGTAMGAATSVETVTYSPQVFNFQVTPQGGPSGSNNITFSISRKEEDRGVFNKCRKIQAVVIGHDPNPMYGTQHPGDYLVGRKELNPPLCNFQNIQVSGQPFLEEDINSTCYETPTRGMPGAQVPTGPPTFMAGRSSVIGRELTVAFHQTSSLDRAVPEKKIYLQANIQCVESAATGAVGPNWGRVDTRQAGGTTGSGAGSGTGTAVGTAPAPTAGSSYGGRQFTPVDPRTPPRIPVGGRSTQPEVVPRDPRTVPRVPVGSGTPKPGTVPRDPGTRPGPAGGTSGQSAPSCLMNGTWVQDNAKYWNFAKDPLFLSKYYVQVERAPSSSPVDIPVPLPTPCNESNAFLNGSNLRVYCKGDPSVIVSNPVFFEGTIDGTCNQVSGMMYRSNGMNQPATLIRSRNLRLPVPNP
jgi:hypothetical protein